MSTYVIDNNPADLEPNSEDHLKDCLCKVTNGYCTFYKVAQYDYYNSAWSCEDEYDVLSWALLPDV